METKISAQELMAVVADTNNKVTALTEPKKEETFESKVFSRVGSYIVIVLSVLGILLAGASGSIYHPRVLEAMYSLFSEPVWKIVYIAYAVVMLLVATLVRIKTPLRIWAVIVAIAPICIQVILGIL